MPRTSILWFRRDLRVHDHPALVAAVAASDVVIPVFVFDDALLGGRWPSSNRVWFMRESVVALSGALAARGSGLRALRGRPVDVLAELAREVGADRLYLTRDAAPFGRRRDREVAERLAAIGVTTHAEPGLYVHEPDQVSTVDGRPFSVFGAFHRAWGARAPRPIVEAPDRIPGPPGGRRPDPVPPMAPPTADPALMPAPGEAAARARLAGWLDQDLVDGYATDRNRLDLDRTSRLSQDLRFGLLSPVEVLERTAGRGDGSARYAAELAWREFYAHIAWHHPHVVREPFRSSLATLPFRSDPEAFEAWRTGRTGYPVVDAAMRQLRGSGFVHNRARMIAASFLVKHLLIDYRLGEAEFMRHLTDGDVASNNGGWQWVAGVGTDPQPWFRVFNPTLQGRRFDPSGDYVRRWVPELRGIAGDAVHEPWMLDEDARRAAGLRIGVDYPVPIVDHAGARERALAAFRATRGAAPSRTDAVP
jgi:deoxyribodipyrimidine photo-lyase